VETHKRRHGICDICARRVGVNKNGTLVRHSSRTPQTTLSGGVTKRPKLFCGGSGRIAANFREIAASFGRFPSKYSRIND
jgi:hypothetical protein